MGICLSTETSFPILSNKFCSQYNMVWIADIDFDLDPKNSVTCISGSGYMYLLNFKLSRFS